MVRGAGLTREKNQREGGTFQFEQQSNFSR